MIAYVALVAVLLFANYKLGKKLKAEEPWNDETKSA